MKGDLHFCNRCGNFITEKQGGKVFTVCFDCARIMMHTAQVVIHGWSRNMVKELLEIAR